jgi:diaminohydroxyphosphoribosylaminopyrimidine deaminase / 5-amino-6-(5-phosphoribosylamino)uracil reductase
MKDEAAFSNRAWLMKIRKNRPFFTWKVAATLDGKVAAADGTSKWITNEHLGLMCRYCVAKQMRFL